MAIPQKLLDDAMAGNAQAQLEIGRYHAEGREVPYDLDEAYRWFRLAANHKLPAALLEVALAHEYGLGTDVDHDSAFEHYMEAIRLFPKPLPFTIRGMVLTQNLCLANHRGQMALAEAGYAHSQWAFAYGPKRENQWKENKDSHKWTRLAAELGYPPAFKAMAWTISAGKGVPSDEDKTLEWHLKAYEHDKLVAKSLSMLFLPADPSSWLSKHLDPKVRGVVPDKAKSEEWNRVWQGHIIHRRMLEVAGGSAMTAKSLAELYLNGSEGVEKDHAEAMRWLVKAYELGCNWSPGQIAKMYLHGQGVPVDVSKGLEWLDRQYASVCCEGTKIPDQGLIFHWAMRPVVEGYLDGLDEDELFVWLQKRTKAYVPDCGALQGSYYGDSESARIASHVCKAFVPHAHVQGELNAADRRSVDRRVGRITRLMKRQEAAMIESAKAGDPVAQFWLSRNFERYKFRAGRALQWLLKSAEQGFSPAQFKAGKAYVEGDGAPVSESDARKWFLKAAYQGHTSAQLELIGVLNGSQFWGDHADKVERKPSKADILEAHAWRIASGKRMHGRSWSEGFSAKQLLAAYRRADEIRAQLAAAIGA